MKHSITPIMLVLAVSLFGACESGGNGQTKRAKSNPSAQATEQTKQTADETNTPTARESGGGWEIKSTERPKTRLDPGEIPEVGDELDLSRKEWRSRLTKEEFHILRESGTEPANSGELLDNKATGIYYCAGCGAPLFSSRHKFESNTGWPSFYRPYEPTRIETKPDHSLGMTRTEIVCARCGGHLGHVFDDGPKPTGKRYCINSLALDFKPAEPATSPDGGTTASSGPDAGSSPSTSPGPSTDD